jgi:hypothetical protein
MNLSAVLKWIGYAKIILPFVFQAKGLDPQLAGHITDLVTDAETALGPGTGEQKAAAVLKGVEDGMTAAGASPAKIGATKDLVQIGLTDGIKAVNDVHELHATP